jgi:hypothetical protein
MRGGVETEGGETEWLGLVLRGTAVVIFIGYRRAFRNSVYVNSLCKVVR